jgi:hypothetical protein
MPVVSRVSWGAALRLVVTCGVVLAAVGCKRRGGQGDEPACVQRGPAFRLLVTAPQGSLPDDTQLEMNYQGNLHARFGLAAQTVSEDLCCAAHGAVPTRFEGTPCQQDAGSFPDDVAAIACDVWSNGAASVTLSASGYETRVYELEAEVDEECETILTSEQHLQLQRGDAGPQ